VLFPPISLPACCLPTVFPSRAPSIASTTALLGWRSPSKNKHWRHFVLWPDRASCLPPTSYQYVPSCIPRGLFLLPNISLDDPRISIAKQSRIGFTSPLPVRRPINSSVCKSHSSTFSTRRSQVSWCRGWGPSGDIPVMIWGQSSAMVQLFHTLTTVLKELILLLRGRRFLSFAT